MSLDKVILHQDNAPSHRAESTQLEIGLIGFDVLEHPPYNPDLAQVDFRVFPELKSEFAWNMIRFSGGTYQADSDHCIVINRRLVYGNLHQVDEQTQEMRRYCW